MSDADSRKIATDSRGTILIVGVVAGALLVGALWHLASIGDAIAWREGAQDAADAGAFENAVWNARGMNVIVSINIVMSLVLAVLVVWRTILIILSIAMIIGVALCAETLGAGCGFTTTVARYEKAMLDKDKTVADNVLRVLKAISPAQVAVASVTPLIGMGQASSNTEGSYEVSSASTQSTSLLPSFNPELVAKLQVCLRGGSPYKGSHREMTPKEFYREFMANPRLGLGVSLPMQEESYSALCEKAGAAFGENMAGVLERMGAPDGVIKGIDAVNMVLGKVVGTLPALFCAPIGKGETPPGVMEKLGDQAVASCRSQLKDARVFAGHTDDPAELKYRDDDGNLVSEEDYVKGCTKKKQKEATDQLKKQAQPEDKSYDMTQCATPAKVWEYAANGNLFMRSFAQVEKGKPMAEGDARGLEVADRASTGNLRQLADQEVVAHAEMYFDCEERWMECRGNAPWQIRWRARLRRVQPLDHLLATGIAPVIAATLARMFESSGSKVGENMISEKLSKIIVSDLEDTSLVDYLTRDVYEAQLTKRGHLDAVGKFIVDQSKRGTTVH